MPVSDGGVAHIYSWPLMTADLPYFDCEYPRKLARGSSRSILGPWSRGWRYRRRGSDQLIAQGTAIVKNEKPVFIAPHRDDSDFYDFDNLEPAQRQYLETLSSTRIVT